MREVFQAALSCECLFPQKPLSLAKAVQNVFAFKENCPSSIFQIAQTGIHREYKLKIKALENQSHSTMGMYFSCNQKTIDLTKKKRNKESQID